MIRKRKPVDADRVNTESRKNMEDIRTFFEEIKENRPITFQTKVDDIYQEYEERIEDLDQAYSNNSPDAIRNLISSIASIDNMEISPDASDEYVMDKILYEGKELFYEYVKLQAFAKVRDLVVETTNDLERKGRFLDGCKIYPNEPCPCGSGKKYKKCCGQKNLSWDEKKELIEKTFTNDK